MFFELHHNNVIDLHLNNLYTILRKQFSYIRQGLRGIFDSMIPLNEKMILKYRFVCTLGGLDRVDKH